MFSILAQHGGEIRLHVSWQSVREPQAALWHTKTGAPFSSNVSQPRWVTEQLALLETSVSVLRLLVAGAVGIIRELVGIRGLSNPNLHIDSTIISLVFKWDYMLQLKEASEGSFRETATASLGHFGEFWRKGLDCRVQSWSGRTVRVEPVEQLSHELDAKHGWRCINMDCTQRNIFI